jgi:hypothetical protein
VRRDLLMKACSAKVHVNTRYASYPDNKRQAHSFEKSRNVRQQRRLTQGFLKHVTGPSVRKCRNIIYHCLKLKQVDRISSKATKVNQLTVQFQLVQVRGRIRGVGCVSSAAASFIQRLGARPRAVSSHHGSVASTSLSLQGLPNPCLSAK